MVLWKSSKSSKGFIYVICCTKIRKFQLVWIDSTLESFDDTGSFQTFVVFVVQEWGNEDWGNLN